MSHQLQCPTKYRHPLTYQTAPKWAFKTGPAAGGDGFSRPNLAFSVWPAHSAYLTPRWTSLAREIRGLRPRINPSISHRNPRIGPLKTAPKRAFKTGPAAGGDGCSRPNLVFSLWPAHSPSLTSLWTSLAREMRGLRPRRSPSTSHRNPRIRPYITRVQK